MPALILVNATFILPFVVVIVRQTFQDLPIELEEAALVDGGSHFVAFFRVAIPLALPAIAASALIMFAFAWNEYLFAVILTIKESATMPVHIAGGVDSARRAVLVRGGALAHRHGPAGLDRALRAALLRPRPYPRRGQRISGENKPWHRYRSAKSTSPSMTPP